MLTHPTRFERDIPWVDIVIEALRVQPIVIDDLISTEWNWMIPFLTKIRPFVLLWKINRCRFGFTVVWICWPFIQLSYFQHEHSQDYVTRLPAVLKDLRKELLIIRVEQDRFYYFEDAHVARFSDKFRGNDIIFIQKHRGRWILKEICMYRA